MSLEEERTMTRTYEVLSSTFGCLALILLVLGVLAVPTQEARAADDCGDNCKRGEICVNGECQTPPQSCPHPTVNPCSGITNSVFCLADGCNNGTSSCD